MRRLTAFWVVANPHVQRVRSGWLLPRALWCSHRGASRVWRQNRSL